MVLSLVDLLNIKQRERLRELFRYDVAQNIFKKKIFFFTKKEKRRKREKALRLKAAYRT